jgi:hypothetical protein
MRRRAGGDFAVGVALELKVPAGSQVAAERQQPAPDPLGVRACVPDVSYRRAQPATQFDDVRRSQLVTRSGSNPTRSASLCARCVQESIGDPQLAMIAARLAPS